MRKEAPKTVEVRTGVHKTNEDRPSSRMGQNLWWIFYLSAAELEQEFG